MRSMDHSHWSMDAVQTRSGADELGTHVLEYIFEVFVLMEIMGHVLVLKLNVFRFYENI